MLVEHAGKRPEIHPSAYVAPNAVVSGDVRVGPGARILFGAVLTAESGGSVEMRINSVLHVNSVLADDGMLPIGWVAVGDPAEAFPPDRHEDIWVIQRELDFPRTVLGLPRPDPGESFMPEAMARYSDRFGEHRGDTVIE